MTPGRGGFPAQRASASGYGSADFTLADFPEKAARWWGDRVAFAASGTEMTYGAFHDRVRRLASVLSEAGVKEGTGVGLLSGNDQAYYDLFFAGAVLGAVLCRSTSGSHRARSPISATTLMSIRGSEP